MNERAQERVYALIALLILVGVLAIAFALRNSSLTVFPHQVDKVRPGGVLPRNR